MGSADNRTKTDHKNNFREQTSEVEPLWRPRDGEATPLALEGAAGHRGPLAGPQHRQVPVVDPQTLHLRRGWSRLHGGGVVHVSSMIKIEKSFW